MVQVTVGWSGKLEGSETDVVEGLVIDTESLVRVLDQLVNRQSCIIGLNQFIC